MFERLKDVHIYCKLNNVSSNSFGPLVEYYIGKKFKMSKINPSDEMGDMKTSNGFNIEIKASNGGLSHNKFNFVQIRLNHDCQYLLIAYYLDISNVDFDGELFIFRICKNDLKKILLKHGSYAHGTKKKHGIITETILDNVDSTIEYALRPKYNDLCWKLLMEHLMEHLVD